MGFDFEDLNEELFSKVIAFSYCKGSGLGGPGVINFLTNDGKQYLIGEEGFEDDWISPGNTYTFMSEAFGSDGDNGNWVRISKKYASDRIYFRRDLLSNTDSIIEDYRKKHEISGVLFEWQPLVWKILGMDSSKIEHVVYDKTKEIAKQEEENRKKAEEHFRRVLLKPDAFEWRKLYYNNAILKDDTDEWLQGYYLLLFKKVDICRIDGSMMTIAFQREQSEEGVHRTDAKIEAYNLFYQRFEDVRGPLEIPECRGGSPEKELEKSFAGYLTCYCVNTRDRFIRSYSSLKEAKIGAMYWLKVWGGIDSETVIPYGAIRSDASEIRKKEIREAELYMTFVARYAEVIELIKKYDYPGNAADEVAKVLGIDRSEVGFIYNMFDPVLFSAKRLETIKRMVGESL